MRVERSPGAVLIEVGAFGVMVGAIVTVALMVLLGWSFIGAILMGGTAAVIVGVVLWLLTRGTLEPPRGPGNVKPTATPLTDPAKAPVAPKAATLPSSPPKAAPAPKTASGAAKSNGAASSSSQSQEPDPSVGSKPQTLGAPRGGAADDLKKIKGVGPKLEEVLHSMGFYHFDQIAGWSAEEVAWVDENLNGFRGRVTRDDWQSQARELMSGGS